MKHYIKAEVDLTQGSDDIWNQIDEISTLLNAIPKRKGLFSRIKGLFKR